MDCQAPLCDRDARQTAWANGPALCHAHYMQYRRAGFPEDWEAALRPLRPRGASGGCEVSECGMPARYRGLCQYHAERAGRGVDAWPTCRVCGAERTNKDRHRVCEACSKERWRYVEVVGSER